MFSFKIEFTYCNLIDRCEFGEKYINVILKINQTNDCVWKIETILLVAIKNVLKQLKSIVFSVKLLKCAYL